MSLTGIGFDSSTRGGSFLGKKNSSTFRNNDFQSDSSNVALGSNRFSSGPEFSPELTGVVDIVWPSFDLQHFRILVARAPQLDEHLGRQVAFRPQFLPQPAA